MDFIRIAPIEESQISAVVSVINEAYFLEATFKKDPTRIREAEFRELVASGTGQHYVASLDPNHPTSAEYSSKLKEGIVGHIYVEDKGDYSYFGMLAVSPVLHGKGVGGLILAYAEQKMIEAGKTKSGCQVASPIPRLIEYYQKLGYQLTGETMDWESDNLKQKCWFILMRKDLTATPARS